MQAGPRVPCPGSHPAIRATVQESPVFSMMEEMVGLVSSTEGDRVRIWFFHLETTSDRG